MSRRRPSRDIHAIEDALSKPMPEIESDQTRMVLGDYLDDLRPLADRVVPGALRTALRRHVLSLQRRIDEYDAREGDR